MINMLVNGKAKLYFIKYSNKFIIGTVPVMVIVL